MRLNHWLVHYSRIALAHLKSTVLGGMWKKTKAAFCGKMHLIECLLLSTIVHVFYALVLNYTRRFVCWLIPQAQAIDWNNSWRIVGLITLCAYWQCTRNINSRTNRLFVRIIIASLCYTQLLRLGVIWKLQHQQKRHILQSTRKSKPVQL